MQKGILKHNNINNRYGILGKNGWITSGLHCGEQLEVKVNGKWTKTTIEMAWEPGGNQWYLVATPYRGILDDVEARIK